MTKCIRMVRPLFSAPIIALIAGLMLAGVVPALGQGGYAAAADSFPTIAPSLGAEVGLFLKLIFGLAIVLVLLIFTVWVLKRFMRLHAVPGAVDAMEVLAIRYMDPKKAIALVRVLDRVLIIGISDQSLTTLGELTPEEAGSVRRDTTVGQQGFGELLARLSGRRPSSG